ncbi:MAG TPA: DUF222 domain-containing protein, partial [Candidatus Dormibacteraeota bacterium]|nr:DUF222 domain-containing protein [Candidatus Dormibacteraeota bacterium]
MLQTVSRGAEIARRLIQNQRQIDMLQLEQSRLCAEFAETDHWSDEGSNTPLDWIRFNCNVTEKVAGDRLAVGQRCGEIAASVRAMESGEIGFSHLAVMARTAIATGAKFDETRLLEVARKTSPGKFYYESLHYRHSVDAKAYAAEQVDLVENRRLWLSKGEDGGLLINGVLDPVGGAAFRTALEPLARRAGWDDDRNLEKRYADALVELASNGGQVRVQMQVTASIETLLGMIGAPGAENEFSLPISAKTVERWACDCSLTRVLMQDSIVIDVGRSERTIRGPRRRALIARDQHCQWADCERPASWCDGHHLVHWLNGGGGEIENQVLLCHRHHWLV